jgi:hypothetical protein
MGFTSSKGSDNAVFAPAKSWTLLEIRCPIGCFETTTVNQFKTQLGTTINLKAAQNQSSPVDMLECRDPAWKVCYFDRRAANDHP